MILKGNQRGNGRELANHLMRGKENEHIELHDLRGFVADDLHGAMQESEAIAKGTRCKAHLFSLSLNPPQDQEVSIETFEAAIARVESELGLEGQPRAIVFHEKEGRRHCHAVWSRIDGEKMKAIKLDFYKRTLNGIARDLYREHGWDMPKGFREAGARDPLSFSREEWQQAKRTKQEPSAIKLALQQCWSGSDSRQAFETALRARGYFLARGDQRGYVAVDWRGEVYSLTRATGAKVSDLKSRLGDAQHLQTAQQAKEFIAKRMTPRLVAWVKDVEAQAEKYNLTARFQREQMVQRHRHAREQLKYQQEERALSEARQRADRTPTGLRGLWGWITGKNRKIREENESEMARAQQRDRDEKQAIVQVQLRERRTLQRRVVEARSAQQARVQELNREVAHYIMLGEDAPREITKTFAAEAKRAPRQREPEQTRGRGSRRDFTPR
jgi:hypothetical protein